MAMNHLWDIIYWNGLDPSVIAGECFVVVYITSFNFVYSIQNERRIRADKQGIFQLTKRTGISSFLYKSQVLSMCPEGSTKQ